MKDTWRMKIIIDLGSVERNLLESWFLWIDICCYDYNNNITISPNPAHDILYLEGM
jgi:hypothetical protein